MEDEARSNSQLNFIICKRVPPSTTTGSGVPRALSLWAATAGSPLYAWRACVRGYTTPRACSRSISLHSYRLLASLVVHHSPLSVLSCASCRYSSRFHSVGRAWVLAFFTLRSLPSSLTHTLSLSLTVSILSLSLTGCCWSLLSALAFAPSSLRSFFKVQY